MKPRKSSLALLAATAAVTALAGWAVLRPAPTPQRRPDSVAAGVRLARVSPERKLAAVWKGLSGGAAGLLSRHPAEVGAGAEAGEALAPLGGAAGPRAGHRGGGGEGGGLGSGFRGHQEAAGEALAARGTGKGGRG